MASRNLSSSAPASRLRRAQAVFSPTVKLSVEVEPLLAAVGRHIKLTPRLRSTLAAELAAALERSPIRLTVADSPGRSREDEAGEEEADKVLTTEEAARLAGVSRPFMARLIDEGRIPLHLKVGNQRRVSHGAVLAWVQAERATQRRALKKLASSLDDEIF